MYYLDKIHHQDGSKIYRTRNSFNYPIQKNKYGVYKIKSGERIRVCMTSDFFLPEADKWRIEAYKLMEQRKDVIFWLLTKRINRVKDHMPGYLHNICMNVTCENQLMADERLPLLLQLPFNHKGIMAAPLIGPLNLEKYLATNQIESVLVDGENYEGNRILDYDWVIHLYQQCRKYNVHFEFIGTGNFLKKDNRIYKIQHDKQKEIARKSGLYWEGKTVYYDLQNNVEQLSLFEINDHPCTNCITRQCSSCKYNI